MKKYLIEKLKALRQLFVSSSKTERDLKKRIDEAKKVVKHNSYGNMIFVENYQEVRDILQYEDTLGIALFVRDFIARQVPTEICVKYLLRA